MMCSRLRRRRGSHDKLMLTSRKNIVITGVPDRGRRYLSDFYTTLIDIQWRWNLLFFVVCFVITWLVFAIYYLLLCFLHGDLEPQNRADNSSWVPCVTNVNSFTEAYLFSIETMSTIGYGWRCQTEECPGVYLAVMLQSVIGAGLQFALASLVVSKTRRAKTRSLTILFSNTAVIYEEDGQLKLAVRIGDMRKGDVIGAHATGMLIKKTTGKTGHKVPVRMFTVPFDAESGRPKLFLCWPSLLVHSVDQHSPLWPLSRDDLLNGMYELIVVLDGVAATTSKPFQARKSYHSWEIMWGRRFKPLRTNMDDADAASYEVNYSTFHDTFPVSVPLCSSQTVANRRILEQLRDQLGEGSDLDAELLKHFPDMMGVRPTDSPSFAGGTGSQRSPTRRTMGAAASPGSSEGRGESSRSDSLEDVEGMQGRDRSKRRRSVKDSSDGVRRASTTKAEGHRQTASTDAAENGSLEAASSASGASPSSGQKERVRKTSRVEFQPVPSVVPAPSTSAGSKDGQPQRRLSIGDALNMYRHRRSVTDTYLGTELPEEESDDSEASAAILSIVSQQSGRGQQAGKPDVRDVFKLRRKSTTQELMFGVKDADGEAKNS